MHREIAARNVGFDDVGREIAGLPKDGENFLVILRDFLRAREQAWRKWKARQ